MCCVLEWNVDKSCRRFLLLLIVSTSIASAETMVDNRTLVEMPPETQLMLRLEMMDHMATVNELIVNLGSRDLETVAKVAEKRLGMSSMGKHRATGKGPGRYMPQEMRQIGLGMHRAASNLAEVAAQGDFDASLSAMQAITSSCVACHGAFRVR